MESLEFNVVDPLGENEYLVELPMETVSKKLLPELITALGLEKGSYAIEHVSTKRILGPEETLSSIGAKPQDYLRILATPVAA